MIEDEVLKILRCPESGEPLLSFEEDGFLFCPASRMKYRIENGILFLLVDEGTRVDEAEANALVERAGNG